MDQEPLHRSNSLWLAAAVIVIGTAGIVAGSVSPVLLQQYPTAALWCAIVAAGCSAAYKVLSYLTGISIFRPQEEQTLHARIEELRAQVPPEARAIIHQTQPADKAIEHCREKDSAP
jgi:hypothetical protein